MHSPWGMLFQLVHETGWDLHTILWKVSRANLLLMMADRSNFKNIKDQPQAETGSDLFSRIKTKASRGEI